VKREEKEKIQLMDKLLPGTTWAQSHLGHLRSHTEYLTIGPQSMRKLAFHSLIPIFYELRGVHPSPQQFQDSL
jgi:hypothetical protein